MKSALIDHYHMPIQGRLLLKKDSHLPISGSIKARGGIYEVLAYAEKLALEHHLITENDDYSQLCEERLKIFSAVIVLQ